MPRDPRSRPGPRAAAKRELIVETPVRTFAERGYQGAKVEDVAAELAHLEGLGLPALREQGRLVPRRLPQSRRDAPRVARRTGRRQGGRLLVGARLLARTDGAPRAGELGPYRVTLMGTYGTDLALRTEINRYMVSEDPYGTLEFVEFGIGTGDLRADLDVEMAASMLDWMAGGFQDALVEQGPRPGPAPPPPEPRAAAGPADRAVRGPASPFARCGAVERTAQEAGRRRMADLASATVTFPLR